MKRDSKKFLIVVAGLPTNLGPAFKKEIPKLEEGIRKLIWLPINNKNLCDTEYTRELYNKLHSECHSQYDLGKSLLESNSFKGAMTIYFTHLIGKNLIEKAFGIETLTIGMSMPEDYIPGRQSNAKLQKTVNDIVKKIRKTMRRGERVLSAISNEVVSNDNQTPLLLPERNFDTIEIQKLAGEVGRIALSETDAFEAIKKIKTDFNSRNPKINNQDYGKSYKNKKNILFRGPGKNNRHALAAVSAHGHKQQCLIRGRMRLGAAYDPRFHYDCTSLKGAVSRKWESCHEQDFSLPIGRTHVNISPNDHTR